MREIKFRAWDKVGEKMYHFGLFNNFEVDNLGPNKEIMQYIGIKDRFGIDIYECDILRRLITNPRPDKITGKAALYPSNYKTNVRIVEIDHSKKHIIGKDKGEMRWIVIGNKYENPELLEKYKFLEGGKDE